jgi:hypothetical protein
MYSTCIHCQSELGRNALIETLPVGRRIAFDEATGRLWVVCPSCARWNLVPFESRFEAIESGEKLYRAASQRMSTGEIGLAKTSEGTELVRIGQALRPEMAAWRYGAQLVKRRWKYAATAVPIGLVLAVIGSPGLALDMIGVRPLALPFVGQLLFHVLNRRWQLSRTRARVSTECGSAFVTMKTVCAARLHASPDGATSLWLPIVQQPIEDVSIMRQLGAPLLTLAQFFRPSAEVTGSARVDAPTHYAMLGQDEMLPALRVMLPVLNEAGASRRHLRDATSVITQAAPTLGSVAYENHADSESAGRAQLGLIPKPRRLALEMLVHEDSERRWLASDLLDLEMEWRRANEIAAIADGLLRDPAIEERLSALRDSSAGKALRVD